MAFEGDNMMGVKRNNRASVLQLLHTNGNLSRKNLAEKMHLTAAAITKIVAEMENEGLLIEGDAIATGNAGRREILVEINKDYAVALGIHINIKSVIISAVNLNGELLFSQSVSIAPSAPADATLRTITGILNQLIRDYSIDRKRIIGIGVAVRGHISNDKRISLDSYGAFSDKDYPICEKIEDITGIPTIMENNVRSLHAAQIFFDRYTIQSTQLFLRCEYGIGSSISIDGKIWNGVSQSCGEIGHVPVVRKNGRLCSCGRYGCLETVASPAAIVEILTEQLSEQMTPVLWKICQEKATAEPNLADISKALEDNDPGVVNVVEKATFELSSALESVVKVIDPDTIILYGRLFEDSRFIDMLIEKKNEFYQSVKMEKSKYNCTLDDKAACLLAVNEFFNRGGTI